VRCWACQGRGHLAYQCERRARGERRRALAEVNAISVEPQRVLEVNGIRRESSKPEEADPTEKGKPNDRMQMEMGTCVRGYERRYIKMIGGLREQLSLTVSGLRESLQTALDSVRDGLTDISGGGVQWRTGSDGREVNYVYVAAPGARVIRRSPIAGRWGEKPYIREGARA